MDLQHWSVYGTWFSGVATLAVVFIALYLQRRNEKRRRPRLVVAYERADTQPNGDNRYLPPEPGSDPNHEELWLRVRVKNTSNVTAQEVEVRFISIKRERKGPESRPSWWLKVSNFNGTAIAIPSEFEQHFDLAFLRNNVSDSSDILFYLAIVQPPLRLWQDEKTQIENRRENRLEIGFRYDLSFAVVSANADAEFYRMTLRTIPRGTDDPHAEAQSGERYLLGRVEVSPPVRISSKEAFEI